MTLCVERLAGMNDIPDILQNILRRKVEEIVERAERLNIRDLSKRAELAPPLRGFVREIEAFAARYARKHGGPQP